MELAVPAVPAVPDPPSIAITEKGETGEATFGGALSFGSVAALYDSARPDYPERLIDAVLEYAQLPDEARALEIGAGTGQATAQFAWRGLNVHALEPSREMVELMLDRFDGTDLNVTVTETALESAELEPAAYELVYCATAWHWLEPRLRWEIVAKALRPGGTLAVLFHVPMWRETVLRPELDELYRQSGAPLDKMGPMLLESIPTVKAFGADWVADQPDPELFGDMRAIALNWAVELPAAQYVELLGTYGDHIGLDADVRRRLFDGIVELIDGAGGLIEVRYSTFLLLTRFTP